MSGMRLYLLRHGKPDVEPGRCYGGTDLDVPMDEHLRIINANLPLLPRGLPLYASPLRRCRELAGMLAQRLGAQVPMLDARLAEMHFGAWEMQPWDRIPREEIDAWAADMAEYRPGNGERVMDVAARVAGFHADLLAGKTEGAIVVAHAGTMRLLKECAQGGPLRDIALRAARSRHGIAYGELLVLEFGQGNSGQ